MIFLFVCFVLIIVTIPILIFYFKYLIFKTSCPKCSSQVDVRNNLELISVDKEDVILNGRLTRENDFDKRFNTKTSKIHTSTWKTCCSNCNFEFQFTSTNAIKLMMYYSIHNNTNVKKLMKRADKVSSRMDSLNQRKW
jgi:hypothetical protein